ncbi:DUF4383 domain-containing protein [Streptomonospora algeriensis]|uniref:DUF4383 domain-containing protein n=1 Tax=Streptomonospora algeriensis TaxID=995084 RepID=A0ABW3BCD2_9ACTN
MATAHSDRMSAGFTGHPVRIFSAVVGLVFLIVGILGFIPGVTTGYGQLGLWGPASEAYLLGIFQVSVLHNIVHLLFGVAGLAMARASRAAAVFLIGGGVVYLVLWLYGLFVGSESPANFVPLNSADNWLHLGLGIGMIALGIIGSLLEKTSA